MKILIIRTYPSQLNPDSYNVQEIGLALALVRKGHTCGIVMYLESGESYTEKRDDGITIYWIHGRKMLKNGFFPGIYKIMEQYDIVQVHEYDQLQSWMIYTYHNKKHNVVMYHGPYYDDFNKNPKPYIDEIHRQLENEQNGKNTKPFKPKEKSNKKELEK